MLIVFFPAGGLRRDTSDNLEYRGSDGFYWFSSAETEKYGWSIRLRAAGIYLFPYNRTTGFSVRCVACIEGTTAAFDCSFISLVVLLDK